jgi:hypothetical protein
VGLLREITRSWTLIQAGKIKMRKNSPNSNNSRITPNDLHHECHLFKKSKYEKAKQKGKGPNLIVLNIPVHIGERNQSLYPTTVLTVLSKGKGSYLIDLIM